MSNSSKKEVEYTRDDKVSNIHKYAVQLPDKLLDIVHDLVTEVRLKPKDKLTKKEIKYNTVLEFLNIVLDKINKDKIDKIEDFKVYRHELVKIDGITAHVN